jgi:hypothetical protein
MDEQKIKRIFPRSSKSFLDANSGLQDTKFERSIFPKSLAKNGGEKKSAGRIILKYTSYRQRLLDADNVCTKFLTDALRYVNALPGDSPDQIDLQETQKKVEKKTQEKTLIEIIYP